MSEQKQSMGVEQKKWYHLNLRPFMLLAFGALLSISIIIVVVFNFYIFQNIQIEVHQEDLLEVGKEAFGKSSEIVHGSVKALEALALSPNLLEAVEARNETYDGVSQSEIDEMIATLDQGWKDEEPAVQDLVDSIEQNAVSDQLRSFLTQFPEEVEVFMTDNQGLNVAMTERTGDYWQADEGWWQGAWDNGQGKTYLSEVDFDDSSGVYAIDIGVPIRDANGKTVGILRGTVNITVVFSSLSEIHFGETGNVSLIDNHGTILYTDDKNLLMTPASEEIVEMSHATENHVEVGLNDLDGNEAIVAFIEPNDEILAQLGWILLLDQDLSEINGEIIWNMMPTTGVGAVLIIIGLVVVLLIVNGLIKPIQIMTQGLTGLKAGNLNRDIPVEVKMQIVSRSDELGQMGQGLAQTEFYLTEMSEIAQEIASGNLAVTVQPRSEKDELGNAMKQMVEGLTELVSGVQASAVNLSESSNQLATASNQAGQAANQIGSTIQQVATGNQQQTESVTTTANQVDQLTRAIDGVATGAQEQASAIGTASELTARISSSAEDVATNANSGAKTAENTANTARSGSQTVERNLAAMDTIKEKVDLSAEKVKLMGERSEEIGAILETINDIASQTNMLALNAAIEAARAGEHGKGFAVVADEVRRLAEHSSEATEEIAKLIEEVQATVEEAVSAMNESASEVETGVATANEAGTALNEILSAAEEVNSQVQKIFTASTEMEKFANELVGSMDTVSAVVEENTAATEQMSASSSEVTKAIEDISSISEENAAAVEEVSAGTEEMNAQVEEVAASANDLSDMAQQLNQIVSRFTLEASEESINDLEGEAKTEDFTELED